MNNAAGKLRSGVGEHKDRLSKVVREISAIIIVNSLNRWVVHKIQKPEKVWGIVWP